MDFFLKNWKNVWEKLDKCMTSQEKINRQLNEVGKRFEKGKKILKKKLVIFKKLKSVIFLRIDKAVNCSFQKIYNIPGSEALTGPLDV